jgi:hypothetical protein
VSPGDGSFGAPALGGLAAPVTLGFTVNTTDTDVGEKTYSYPLPGGRMRVKSLCEPLAVTGGGPSKGAAGPSRGSVASLRHGKDRFAVQAEQTQTVR